MIRMAIEEHIPFNKYLNITVEELSRWFVNELIHDRQELDKHKIEKVLIKVFSAPGQSASHEWQRS